MPGMKLRLLEIANRAASLKRLKGIGCIAYFLFVTPLVMLQGLNVESSILTLSAIVIVCGPAYLFLDTRRKRLQRELKREIQLAGPLKVLEELSKTGVYRFQACIELMPELRSTEIVPAQPPHGRGDEPLPDSDPALPP